MKQIPNLNPNNNLTCPDGATFQGLIFDGSNVDPTISIVKGADTVASFSLKNVFFPVNEYMSQNFTVKANSSIFIDGDNITNSLGTAEFIMLIVCYPEVDINMIIIDTNDKYINFVYPAMGTNVLNIGKIMMLSGTSLSSPLTGWDFANGSPNGITFTNPHLTFDVKVQLLVCN